MYSTLDKKKKLDEEKLTLEPLIYLKNFPCFNILVFVDSLLVINAKIEQKFTCGLWKCNWVGYNFTNHGMD